MNTLRRKCCVGVLIVVVAMMWPLLSWAAPQGDTAQLTVAGVTNVTFPLAQPVTLSVMGPQKWYPSAGQLVWVDVQQRLNLKLDFNEIPYPEKKEITLATGNLQDLVEVTASESFQYGNAGAFVELSQYLPFMPNVQKWLDRYSQYRFAYTLSDGKMYGLPKFTTQNDKDVGWGYNQDQLEDHNQLTVPTSLTELASVAAKFHGKNPDIYPIIGYVRTGRFFPPDVNTTLQAIMNTLDVGDVDVNFFRSDGKFHYTPLQQGFKDAVVYNKMLYDEQLVSPQYLTLNWKGWQKGFENAPNVSGQWQLAPFSAGRDFNRLVNILRWHQWSVDGVRDQWWPEVYPMLLSQTMSLPQDIPLRGKAANPEVIAFNKQLERDPQKLSVALAFMDWLYSDEGTRWLNYGAEGVHYDMVGGNPVVRTQYRGNTPEFYARDAAWKEVSAREDVKGDVTKISEEEKRSIESYGLYQVWNSYPLNPVFVFDGEAQRWPSPSSQATIAKIAELERTGNVVGKFPLPFTVDQQRRVIDLKTTAQDTVLKNVDLFITGRRSMNDWDAFMQEVEAAGGAELEQLYNQVYTSRVLNRG